MIDDSTLKNRALELLKSNIKEGFSKNLNKSFFYISPDRVHYHQWFWDSCFHAIVMSHFKPEYAKRELETLLSVQLSNGFIPHIIFWKWRLRDHLQRWWKKEVNEEHGKFITAEVQPPVIGISLKEVFKHSEDLDFLKRNIESVENFYNYLSGNRDPDNDKLISIITPMESGMDMCPHYDIPFENSKHSPSRTKRGVTKILEKYKRWNWNLDKIFASELFDVEDVSFNTIYCLGLKALSSLYSSIDIKKSELLESRAKSVEEKIIEKFWNENDKIFYSIFHKNKKEYQIKVKTISSLFPVALDIPEEYRKYLLEHIKNKEEFWTAYPLSSVSIDEPSFGPLTNTRYIWRGTTWINTNWFIAKGLKKHGYDREYEMLKEKTLNMVKKFGFQEFYDPFTGNPGRAMRNFGWSTLAVDLT